MAKINSIEKLIIILVLFIVTKCPYPTCKLGKTLFWLSIFIIISEYAGLFPAWPIYTSARLGQFCARLLYNYISENKSEQREKRRGKGRKMESTV